AVLANNGPLVRPLIFSSSFEILLICFNDHKQRPIQSIHGPCNPLVASRKISSSLVMETTSISNDLLDPTMNHTKIRIFSSPFRFGGRLKGNVLRVKLAGFFTTRRMIKPGGPFQTLEDMLRACVIDFKKE
ncbi:hypothetical protein HAX54_031328, partial [Datura stramonium]|nr:hypothetical protein [Datura stramonium]